MTRRARNAGIFSPLHCHCFSCRLLIVGGGAGGCTMAAKFAKQLGKDRVIVLDPASVIWFLKTNFLSLTEGVTKLMVQRILG